MGFDIRRGLYSSVVIGFIIFLSSNFSLADESANLRYRQYLDFESLNAANEYQKQDIYFHQFKKDYY